MTEELSQVSEIPGLYGDFKMEEVILQWIWAEQSFLQEDLSTICGKKVKVLQRGEWNRAGEGPDFLNGRIQLDGDIFDGDIEVHFRSSDWWRHGHQKDVNFEGVVLQVTLFTSEQDARDGRTHGGRSVPTLNLLPYLYRGVEEYAEEWMVSKLAGYLPTQSHILEGVRQHTAPAKVSARKRWEAKCRYARKRMESGNWEQAVHQWFMEVLGYRRNRLSMARVALRYPFEYWQIGEVVPSEVYLEEKGWVGSGSRPSNHPKKRLWQYASLWKKNPQWINELKNLRIQDSSKGKPCTRASLGVYDLSRKVRENIWMSVFSASRAHTLWLDCCLPMLQTEHSEDLFLHWYHWPTGDCPHGYREISHSLGWVKGGRTDPFSNGHFQAILQKLTEIPNPLHT